MFEGEKTRECPSTTLHFTPFHSFPILKINDGQKDINSELLTEDRDIWVEVTYHAKPWYYRSCSFTQFTTSLSLSLSLFFLCSVSLARHRAGSQRCRLQYIPGRPHDKEDGVRVESHVPTRIDPHACQRQRMNHSTVTVGLFTYLSNTHTFPTRPQYNTVYYFNYKIVYFIVELNKKSHIQQITTLLTVNTILKKEELEAAITLWRFLELKNEIKTWHPKSILNLNWSTNWETTSGIAFITHEDSIKLRKTTSKKE